MAWLAVDKGYYESPEGDECIFEEKPKRNKYDDCWEDNYEYDGGWESHNNVVYLPKGTIEKLIGKKLTWEDEPVEYGSNDPELQDQIKIYNM